MAVLGGLTFGLLAFGATVAFCELLAVISPPEPGVSAKEHPTAFLELMLSGCYVPLAILCGAIIGWRSMRHRSAGVLA